MTPPDDDAFLEFAVDAPADHARSQDPTVTANDAVDRSRPESPGAALRTAAEEDALIEFVPDTRAVPPPIQNEIDALVDAVSAGGRPRLSSEPEVIEEADDSDLADFVSSPYELRSTPSASIFHPAAVRFVGGSVAAFAAGAFIAWSVLRSFDAQPVSVAVNQPAGIEAPRATTAPAVSPPVAAPVTPPDTTAVTPGRSLDASRTPPSIAPQQPVPTTPVRTTPVPPTTSRPAATTRSAPSPQPTVGLRPQTPRVAEARPEARSREGTPAAVPGEVAPPPATAATRPENALTIPAPAASQPDVPTVDAGIAAIAPPPAVAAVPPMITPPPVAVAPAPAAAALSAAVLDQKAVLDAVREYTDAYQAMDVTATAAVWPSVDRRALARAFATLKSQELALEGCEVAIANKSATARCRGTVEYVRKVGNPTPRTGYQEWVFKMRKLGDDWIIEGVDASQASTLSADAIRRES